MDRSKLIWASIILFIISILLLGISKFQQGQLFHNSVPAGWVQLGVTNFAGGQGVCEVEHPEQYEAVKCKVQVSNECKTHTCEKVYYQNCPGTNAICLNTSLNHLKGCGSRGYDTRGSTNFYYAYAYVYNCPSAIFKLIDKYGKEYPYVIPEYFSYNPGKVKSKMVDFVPNLAVVKAPASSDVLVEKWALYSCEAVGGCIPNIVQCRQDGRAVVKCFDDALPERQGCGAWKVLQYCPTGCIEGKCYSQIINVPKQLNYYQDWDLGVNINNQQGIPVVVKIEELDGTPILTEYGTTPKVHISKSRANGKVKLKVSAVIDGKEKQVAEQTIEFNPLQFNIKVPSTVEYGHSFEMGIVPTLPGFENISLTVELIDQQNKILKVYIGKPPSVPIVNPNAHGNAYLVVKAKHLGNTFEERRLVYFGGSPLEIKLSARSYYQYNNKPIVFYATIKDTLGISLAPSYIEYMGVELNIEQGQIDALPVNPITYLGDGQYEIKAETNGQGDMRANLIVKYQGETIRSDPITIHIKPPTLAIDTSNTKPIASLGEVAKLKFKVRDLMGQLIDPDAIEIRVTNPSATQVQTFHKSDLLNPSKGVFELDYPVSEVEQYSFDIYVDEEGYERATTKATIAVAGSGGTSGPRWMLSVMKIAGGLIAVSLVFFVVFRVLKKTLIK